MDKVTRFFYLCDNAIIINRENNFNIVSGLKVRVIDPSDIMKSD